LFKIANTNIRENKTNSAPLINDSTAKRFFGKNSAYK
jgi:hypothetical protein